jgi:hypothetical protein
MRLVRLFTFFLAAAFVLAGCDSAPSSMTPESESPATSKTANQGGPPGGGPPSGGSPGASGKADVSVTTAIAPNVFCGSLASYQPWAENAVFELATDGPDSFESQNAFAPGNFIVTSFSSWLAQADPEQKFGPAFENECGNRVAWVTRITAPKGETINVADGLSLEIAPNAYRPGGVSTSQDFFYNIGDQYGTVGLQYGPDGQKGTQDDEVITWEDCQDQTPGFFDIGTDCPDVNEIVAIIALGSAPNPQATGTEQEKINSVYNFIANLKNGAITFKAEATFDGSKPTKDTAVLTGKARGTGVTGVKPKNNDVLRQP